MRTWKEYKEELEIIRNTNDEKDMHDRILRAIKEFNEFSPNNELPTMEDVRELQNTPFETLWQLTTIKDSLIPWLFMKLAVVNRDEPVKVKFLEPDFGELASFWAPFIPNLSRE